VHEVDGVAYIRGLMNNGRRTFEPVVDDEEKRKGKELGRDNEVEQHMPEREAGAVAPRPEPSKLGPKRHQGWNQDDTVFWSCQRGRKRIGTSQNSWRRVTNILSQFGTDMFPLLLGGSSFRNLLRR